MGRGTPTGNGAARMHQQGKRMSEGSDAVQPLSGVRVVELAQNLAGPYCSQILADLGADVVKVERPGAGDAARAWGPPFVDGAGSIFAIANRRKRSVAVDVASEAGRDVLRELVAGSDILIEAFRPGTFSRMGYDYATVRSWNPRLIYCSVLAYGEEGPLRELPGYDPLMQAHGGLMSITGAAGGPAARVGTSIVDMGTGMWLAIAVLAALRDVDRTGEGTRLSVALYDTALAWNAYHLVACEETGFVPGRMGSELPMIAPYGAFPTADGELMIAAANDGLFGRLCRALDVAELEGDPRFRDNPARVANRDALNERIRGATSRWTTAVLLRDAGVPCAPIQDVAEVLNDPQTHASGMLVRGTGTTAMPLPIRWNGARTAPGPRPPAVGEDTGGVLGELGVG
jgi:crotonobetainyl-CoA:carnitine CoA-transferase CaiB-like acyl-CoA transferase